MTWTRSNRMAAGTGVLSVCMVLLLSVRPVEGAVVSNVFSSFSVPGQVGPTMVNLSYGGALSTPVYTVHVPYGTPITSLVPQIVLPAGVTCNPGLGVAVDMTAPLLAYTVTHNGVSRQNMARCIVMAPASATRGRYYDMGTPTLRDIWVNPVSGSDSSNGMTRASAYRTIDRAWQDVPADARYSTTGYRIMLCPGNYVNDKAYMDYRYGTYDCPLVFQAADGTNTVFIRYDMQFFSCNFVYYIGINSVATNGGDGLHFDSCEYVYVKNCDIKAGSSSSDRPGKEGLKANQCEYLYIEGCDIGYAWDNALDYMCDHFGHIRDCRIHDSGDWAGYVKGGSSDLTIDGNEFYNADNGGFTTGQGAGSEWLTSPWLHYQAYNIKIFNNLIHDCGGAGIGLNGGYNILLAHNTMYKVGSISHGMEVTFGGNSLDDIGNQSIAQTYTGWGGWTHTEADGDQRIPNRNVYIYNNILYNPMPFKSQWQHFEFTGPYSGNTNTNIPKPAVTDQNLQIKGNIIWNGPPDLSSGIGDGTACQPSNPTCNETLLYAGNHINTIEPQLVNPAGGDFRPVTTGNVHMARTYEIPSFAGDDAPVAPLVPAECLTNRVSSGRGGVPRYRHAPPGAYTGGTSMFLDIGVKSNGAVLLTLLSEAGYSYGIHSSTNLASWSPLMTTNAVAPTNVFPEMGPSGPKRFYRGVLLP